MKILWITNQPTPDIAEAANIKSGFGGGWMNLLSKQIAEKYELAMVFPVSAELEYKNGKNGSVRYYLIPANKVKLKPDSKTVDYIKQTIRDFDPDIIHIWGTEYLHSYEAVTAAEQCGMLDKVVVSIQGLVSVYAEHFYCGLSEYDFRKPTAASLINCNGINKQKSNFVKRGKYERLVLKKVNNVIGRTDWDEACTKQINPSVKYHFCNETLRESFYEHRWDINKCQRYSIFVSQAQYPIKGFHKSLEALAVLKKKYPDVHLYTTGPDRMAKGFKSYLKQGDYDLFIRKMIRKLDLEKNVSFLGALDEEKMCRQYLRSHVFVCSSSIENSPNSVGEAMILGMPVVSSDVGGVKNLMTHDKEGFVYQPDAAYMLAYYIDKFFSDDELSVKYGKNAHSHAMITHNKEKNFKTLLGIYKTIFSQEKGDMMDSV